MLYQVVITDGGEEFTESAMETLRENLERNSCPLSSEEKSQRTDRAQVFLERLTWGDHSDFIESHQSGFDFILAADVLCECGMGLHVNMDLGMRSTRPAGCRYLWSSCGGYQQMLLESGHVMMYDPS